jgi:predicted alpha/beta hydrolase family esterase
MKNAWLLHGTGGSDKDYFWFGDTQKYLEEHGYKVWWPLLPNTDKPELVETRNFVEGTMPSPDKDTVIIAHSSACPLVLSMLQSFGQSVKQVILVSGFYQPIDDEGFSEIMLQKDEYDWDAIKKAADEIIIINSDDDPWGCDDKQARPVAQKLNARFILAKGQGHMGSGNFNQPYRELKLLKTLISI